MIAILKPPSLAQGVRVGRPLSDQGRDAKIICHFKSGMTTIEIAPLFGLTPAGISDVLHRRGIARSEGGKAEAARRAQQRREMRKAFGVPLKPLETKQASLSSFDSLEQAMLAIQRFDEQRNRARQRRIGWTLTFADWWDIWSTSGRWSQRGRQSGNSAVMARHGDIGSYEVGNVSIISLSKNFAESWDSSPGRIHGGRLKRLARISK